MPFKYESMQARILANSVVAPGTLFQGTPCWWWLGSRCGGERYGSIKVRSSRKTKKGERRVRTKMAHRASREAFCGEFFRRGKYGCHLCPPHPNRTLCVNPDHVMQGTPRQNNRQTVAEGRHRNAYK